MAEIVDQSGALQVPCPHSSVSLIEGHYRCDICGEVAQDQDWGQALAINAVLEQARVIANGTLPLVSDVTKLRHLIRAMDKAMGAEVTPARLVTAQVN